MRGNISELVALIDAPETREERAENDELRRWWWWVPLFLIVLLMALAGMYTTVTQTLKALFTN